MSIAYYNGEFTPISDVRIPLSDRAVFFGDGIYEALLERGGRPHLLSEHLDRFYRNVSLMNIPFDMTRDALERLIYEAISLSGEELGFVYFQLTKYSEVRIHACPKTKRYNLLMTVTPQKPPSKSERLKLVTYPDLRYRYCNVKTLNLIPSVIASEYAERHGADEAVLCRGEAVTECSHSNVSIIKNGILYTHPKCELILPGIAREALLCECKRLGIPRREEAFSREELCSADSVIVTSSTKICMLAEEVDKIILPTSSPEALILCENLHKSFFEGRD